MNRKMSKAPVYYVLTQAQFNPIAAMTTYIDEFQEKLRLKGYTLFEYQKTAQLRFAPPTPSVPTKAEVVELPIWRITKPDRTSGFIIGQNYLTYHTTHYLTHDKFFEEFLFGLKTMHSIIKLEHLSRLGLRYLNAVLPQKKETIDQYLIEGLHGIRLENAARYSLNETIFDTQELSPFKSTLVCRVYSRLGSLGYPPDIGPGDLIPMARFDNCLPVPHAVIDLDHFLEGRMPINLEQTKDQLSSLHKYIKQVFATTTTPHAKKVWQ